MFGIVILIVIIFFADSFSSYCKPLLKALAKLEPDSTKEIKKQFEWFVGEI